MPGPFRALLLRQLDIQLPPLLATGWSETWFPTGGDLTTAANNADLINTAVMALYPPGVACPGIRVSDLDVKGDMFPKTPTTKTGTYGLLMDPVPDVADPDIALRFKLTADDPTWRAWRFLRGLPDNLISAIAPLQITTDAPFGGALANLLEIAKQNALMVRKKKGTPPTYTTMPVTGGSYPPLGSPKPLSIRRSGRPFGLRRGRRQP